jgi:O-antigen ligase
MFRERPVFGWGPGTYMFNYAPFQFSYEKTIISTNNADGGNAHSEYIGPLAEEGVLGLLTFVWIIAVTIYTAVILFPKVKDKEVRMVLQCTMLGLITYYIHGSLNNFLDTDKASVPFWGFTAIIVAIALYHEEWEKRKTVRTADSQD